MAVREGRNKKTCGEYSWTMYVPTVEKALKEKAGHMLRGIIIVGSLESNNSAPKNIGPHS